MMAWQSHIRSDAESTESKPSFAVYECTRLKGKKKCPRQKPSMSCFDMKTLIQMSHLRNALSAVSEFVGCLFFAHIIKYQADSSLCPTYRANWTFFHRLSLFSNSHSDKLMLAHFDKPDTPLPSLALSHSLSSSFFHASLFFRITVNSEILCIVTEQNNYIFIYVQ